MLGIMLIYAVRESWIHATAKLTARGSNKLKTKTVTRVEDQYIEGMLHSSSLSKGCSRTHS